MRSRRRTSLLAAIALVSAVVGGCGDGDMMCAHPAAHVCLDPSCCDPACAGAAAEWNGETSNLMPCDTIGYQCGLFEAVCTCDSSHAWSCQGTVVARDMAVPIVLDMSAHD